MLLDELKRLGVEVQYGHAVAGIEAWRWANAHFVTKWIATDMCHRRGGRWHGWIRLCGEFVHGDNTPRYQGFVNWIGSLQCDETIVDEMAILDVWGVGERFGIVPISLRQVYWAGGAAQPVMDAANHGANREELLSIFQDWHAPITKVISQTPESSIGKIYVHDHDPIERWHRENVVLVGDAAHAALHGHAGQGACQAMEDAWHLANCLATHRDSPQQAFAEFTSLGARNVRNYRVQPEQRSSDSDVSDRDEESCRLRNQKSKVADYVAGRLAEHGEGLERHCLPLR